jgi:hypothetical protein
LKRPPQGGAVILLRGRDKVYPLAEVEQTLVGLRDVHSASIVADPNGVILEVHVVATDGRSPKQIVRDVESMLVARLGIQIDHRKISVAQIGEGGAPGPVPVEREAPAAVEGTFLWPSERRIRFVGVSVAQSQLKAEARVELALDGVNTVALESGADSPDSVLRIVAAATLKAVQQFFEGDQVFSLSAVEEASIGGKAVVVVSVVSLSDGREKTLVGSCPVSRDVTRATALATLDAVNRFLRRCRPKEPTEYEVGPAQDS